ncbi:MAG: serine hydrolase [Candidatus Thorarchaeota archaeon]
MITWKSLARIVSIFTLGVMILMLPIIPISGYQPAQTDVVRDYWPTDEWQSTTPEEQDLDSRWLNRINMSIVTDDIAIDSVIIIKNGYIVYEQYYGMWSQQFVHTIQSCTKSVMSALIGIAIDNGFIDSVNQRVLDFFPDYTIDNWDERKNDITIEHLLTMTSGIEWHEVDVPYTDSANDLMTMYDSVDMWEYVLDRPMDNDPGAQWSYHSGGIEVLGGIIWNATGLHVDDFAREYLFEPIGIDSFGWWRPTPSWQFGCSGGLSLLPRNMARFGYLFLNEGYWNGTQVISSEWVQQSTLAYYDTGGYYHYGYTWWSIPGTTFYEATGHYEQKIYVLPEHDIVVAFTGSIADEDWHPTDYYVMEYVIPAVVGSDTSIVWIAFFGTLSTLIIGALVFTLIVKRRSKRILELG